MKNPRILGVILSSTARNDICALIQARARQKVGEDTFVFQLLKGNIGILATGKVKSISMAVVSSNPNVSGDCYTKNSYRPSARLW